MTVPPASTIRFHSFESAKDFCRISKLSGGACAYAVLYGAMLGAIPT